MSGGDVLEDDDKAVPAAHAYQWESAYKRSWEALEEDNDGSLASTLALLARDRLKRRRTAAAKASETPLHRGTIRHLFVVIDLSEAMAAPADGLPPTRLECVLAATETFVSEFLIVNPLGSIGIVATRDGGAEKLTEMTGNSSDHISAIRNRSNREPRGEPSLQNALEIARRSLLHVPSHGSREILILYSALMTCDPGNIFDTIESLKTDNIRVSIIGLSAEMQICKRVCKETKGIYSVVMNEGHLKEILGGHVAPPPIESDKSSSLAIIEMGFPSSSTFELPTLCANHKKPTQSGYMCPKCKTVVCDLPTDCPICSLTLVSSVLLARSYHHLFPVPTYKEVALASSYKSTHCRACQLPFPKSTDDDEKAAKSNSNLDLQQQLKVQERVLMGHAGVGSGRYECSSCKEHYCLECDLYAHEVLRNCAGCLSKRI
ncbi:Ssl1-like-domain-containing protein [Chytriomyces cf. hyalinus JEL632]|nr:Ssl1-like-domain-containing protein [Chytriomyces cf. hyalinus JEL632]